MNTNANTNPAAEFGPKTLTINGKTLPAEYSVTPSGTVYVFVTVQEDGQPVNLRVIIEPNDPAYAAALAAAKGTPAAQPEPAPAPASTVAPASVPAKDFIGKTIQGEGWQIIFDGNAARTRVILQDSASDAMREAVKAAGFYWSNNLESYNKKLTFKAYRAAQALAQKLNAIPA
jgi:hypothetical protein